VWTSEIQSRGPISPGGWLCPRFCPRETETAPKLAHSIASLPEETPADGRFECAVSIRLYASVRSRFEFTSHHAQKTRTCLNSRPTSIRKNVMCFRRSGIKLLADEAEWRSRFPGSVSRPWELRHLGVQGLFVLALSQDLSDQQASRGHPPHHVAMVPIVGPLRGTDALVGKVLEINGAGHLKIVAPEGRCSL
jgi:hypothetical protein